MQARRISSRMWLGGCCSFACLALVLSAGVLPINCVVDGASSSPIRPVSVATCQLLPRRTTIRFPPYGGALAYADNGSDDSDHDDDDDDDSTFEDRRRRSRPSHNSSRNPPTPREQRRRQPPLQGERRRAPHRRQQQQHHKKNPIQSLAEKSIGLTTKTALGTVKQSGKAAYYLIKPKHVEKEELIGLWRMDQSVQLHPNNAIPLECSANIELTGTSVLVTLAVEGEEEDADNHGGDDDETTNDDDSSGQQKSSSAAAAERGSVTLTSRWKFKPAQWPRAAKVEFAAKAFVIESAGRKEQLLFFYKGQVDRKLAARNVIKIKGKIYRIVKTGWRGKNIRHVPVGTFVARRRLRIEQDIMDEDEDGFGDDESGWESDEEDSAQGDDGWSEDEYDEPFEEGAEWDY